MVFKLKRRKLDLKEGLFQKTKKAFKLTEAERGYFKRAKRKIKSKVSSKKLKSLGKRVDFRRLF